LRYEHHEDIFRFQKAYKAVPFQQPFGKGRSDVDALIRDFGGEVVLEAMIVLIQAAEIPA